MPDYQRIAEEIVKMAREDQEMRMRVQKMKADWDSAVDERNTKRMKEIVAEIGWPSISKIGEEASSFAWLLVQHADHNPEFQKRSLELMRALPADEVARENLAYLEDRIRVSEGRPQIYGTQFFSTEDGRLESRPIEDPAHLDERRKAMGLEPLEKNRARILENFKHLEAKKMR